MSNRDLAKDMKILLKLLRKLGKKIADKDKDGETTYMERKTKHTTISWKTNGKPFIFVIPVTPGSYYGVKDMFGRVRRQLKELGIEPPQQFNMRLEPTLTSDEREIQEIGEEIYSLLDKYED